MPLKIRINNLNRKRKICRLKIERAARAVLRSHRKKNAIIDMTFMGDGRIRNLNKRYMSRDRTTDVLAFRLDDEYTFRTKRMIGDIYISSDMAYKNAKRFSSPFDRELILYAIHGVLHLIGFRDKTKKEKERIRKLETRFLSAIWEDKI